MSERWSYCSEYIYCDACAKAVHDVMREMYGVGPDEMTENNRCWDTLGANGGIVVGFGGGLCLYDCQEWMKELTHKVALTACHPIRFVALYDNDTMQEFKVISNATT